MNTRTNPCFNAFHRVININTFVW
ncbi:hypothetical protein MED222_06130 [Vibrio sp. MED222]|nr:hypothetical protein MED222_06130 [Vibrio sp. MED222]